MEGASRFESCPYLMTTVLATSVDADGLPAPVAVASCCESGYHMSANGCVRHRNKPSDPAMFHVQPFIGGGVLWDEMFGAEDSKCARTQRPGQCYEESEVREVLTPVIEAVIRINYFDNPG